MAFEGWLYGFGHACTERTFGISGIIWYHAEIPDGSWTYKHGIPNLRDSIELWQVLFLRQNFPLLLVQHSYIAQLALSDIPYVSPADDEER